jgi:hypothetical protein
MRRVPSQIFAAPKIDGNVDAVSEMFFQEQDDFRNRKMRPAKPRLPEVWPKTQVKALFVPRRIRGFDSSTGVTFSLGCISSEGGT